MDFERKIVESGNSLAILIPNDLVKYYELQKGEKIIISDDEDKIVIHFKKNEK